MKYSVVVVDDEHLIAKNIARNIETVHPAFEIIQICSCGSEALAYIQDNVPNVVFTDIMMPEMDGIELARTLYEKYPFITCVIVSGYNDFQYAKNAIQYHVSDYLLKPINKEELKKCLSKIERNFQTQHPQLEEVLTEAKKAWKPEDIVELVKEYIHKNYQSAIDMTSLSGNLGFSASYLSKIFTKYTGKSPSKYLKEYRIMIAKQIMNDPHVPISVISTQTGFVDQFHFSKTFKSITGMSPTEYKASLAPQSFDSESYL